MRALLVLGLALLGACPKPAPRVLLPLDPGPRVETTLRVTFVDVGQGEAVLIQKGDYDLLIDTGPPGMWEGRLARALGLVRGPLDELVITHPHIDHDGQVAELLAAASVRQVWTNGDTRGPIDFNSTGKFVMGGVYHLEKAGQAMATLKEDQELTPVAGLKLTVLSSGEPAGGYPVIPDAPRTEGTDANNRSTVFLLEYEGRRILLASDIEIESSLYLIRKYCERGAAADCPRLAVDVLQEPHHGSAKFAPELFQATRPRFAIILADYNKPDHCLPRVEVVQTLRRMGTTVFGTSGEGVEDVTLDILDGGKMRWTLPRSPLFAWKRVSGKVCDPVLFQR